MNGIGICYFQDNNFEGAIERFTQSLSLKNGRLSGCQRAGIFCNIGSAYCRMENYKEADEYFNKALNVSDETSPDLQATIMCKLGYILYKQKDYHRAHTFFSDGKNLACRAVKCMYHYLSKKIKITHFFCTRAS